MESGAVHSGMRKYREITSNIMRVCNLTHSLGYSAGCGITFIWYKRSKK